MNEKSSQVGMTYEQALFRDRCAIAVLGGLMSNERVNAEQVPLSAQLAYVMADLMLEARGAGAQKAIDDQESDFWRREREERTLQLQCAALSGLLAGGLDEIDFGFAVEAADGVAQHAGEEGWLE